MNRAEEEWDGDVRAELHVHPEGTWLYVGEPHGILRVPLGEDGRPEAPAEWTPGIRPYGLAADGTGARLYVTDPAAERLLWHALDATGRPTRGVGWQVFTPTVAEPGGTVAAHPSRPLLYVANRDEKAAVSCVPLSEDGRPDDGGTTTLWVRGTAPFRKGLAVHPAGTHLYVSDPQARALNVFALDADGRADSDGPSLTRQVLPAPGPLTVHPAASCLYFAEGETGAVYRTALAPDGLLAPDTAPEQLPDFTAPHCTGIAVHPRGTYLYASTATTLAVTELSPHTGHPSGRPVTLPLPRR
ncbi:hypothetical protein [Streptomyces sp. BPTC-684]|uniref:hypothetical protein n=1 Tax=Streptomyces sp. BPTC-684 TaxID=3043734 RepID=UPI0024B1C1A5|nr:hypothetical protein [Streptomyces sp. BPTC-684]WHM37315.1 hypothetical protein QIY60_10640 [Streptomyces sp. BPTC-684]